MYIQPFSLTKSESRIKEEESIEEKWKQAVQTSNNQKLKELFQNHRRQVNFLKIIFENGDNSLHYAARSGNIKLAKLLIIVGIDVCNI